VTADPIAAAVQTVQGSRKAHPLGAAWDSEEGRANILSFNPDGTDEKVYTTGIRNPAGITIQPATIAFRAIAMGMRNAAVRKLAVPDLTTTVLTLTITGLAADSSLARGTNPRLQRRIAAVVAMFAGAALGSITLRRSVFMALAFSVVLSSLCGFALLISSRLPCARNAEKE
jgi:hypothetical protein